MKDELLRRGLSVEQFKHLPGTDRRYRIGLLESAFFESFFQYTRDGGWMEEAVGESEDWIQIEGMSRWHVKWALHALESSAGTATPNNPL